MKIFIVIIVILITVALLLSKIKEMIILGGSEANDIFLDFVGTVASLVTLWAAIDIRKKLDVHNGGKAESKVKQSNIRIKSRHSNFYYRFNLEVKDILKNLPKCLVDHIIITLSLLAVIIVLFVTYFNDIACHFYGITKEANGQLLTVLLTAIGGGAVIYGLYLNNKRIKEQTEQNNIARIQADTAKKQADIAFNNNNDKRFGDAIGYLNSDNVGIAIGGAYTLFQIAKEDERYVSIIGNIFVEFLSQNAMLSTKLLSIVIQLVFDDIFNVVKLIFRDIEFNIKSIEAIENNIFENCTFKNVKISCLKECQFNNCILDKIYSPTLDNINFDETIITNSRFFDISDVCIMNGIIERCEFGNIIREIMSKVVVCDNKSIKDTKILSRVKISELYLYNNIIEDKLEIDSPLIEDSKIQANNFVKIVCDNIADESIVGDKALITILTQKEYEDLEREKDIKEFIKLALHPPLD